MTYYRMLAYFAGTSILTSIAIANGWAVAAFMGIAILLFQALVLHELRRLM